MFIYDGIEQLKLIAGAILALLGLLVLALCIALLADEVHLWRGALRYHLRQGYTDRFGYLTGRMK